MNHTGIRIHNVIAFILLAAIHITTHSSDAFFEKVAKIHHNLYKTSAEELQFYLGTSFDPPTLISAQDLKAALEDDDEKPFVINVLPTSLYDDCHIVGSHSAPLKGLVDQAREWNRDRKIIVYCALTQCDAGEKAYILLKSMGFTNILDYKGGIKEWFQLDYPTEGPAESSFLHMKSITVTETECFLFPELLVCSRQTRWISRYQDQNDE